MRGTSARQRSSAASRRSNASAAPFRASAARLASGSARAALRSITRESLGAARSRPRRPSSSGPGHGRVGDRAQTRVRALDGEPEAGDLEQLDVVLAVAERRSRGRGRARARSATNASPVPFDTPGLPELEQVRKRRRQEQRPAKRCFQPASISGSGGGSATATSFVGARSSQARRSPTSVTGRCWKSAYAREYSVCSRDEELVVDVDVRRDAERGERRDRLACELELDRLVEEERRPLTGSTTAAPW